MVRPARNLRNCRVLQKRPAEPPGGASSWKVAQNVGALFIAVCQGFGVFPSRGKSMYIVYIWPTRAVPPDVREEPGGALYVHSP